MRLAFAVKAWAAIAPGLQKKEEWLCWADAATCPAGKALAELPHVPAMARRRLSHLAKMAVSVADAVLPSAQYLDIPSVWASRYGEAERSIALLRCHALEEPLSPTAFGLSVHNGIGAQHSMLRSIRANAISVASSQSAPEAGVVEAVGVLNDGAAEVLLVCYDAPLPSGYDVFHDEPVSEFAWAVLLTQLQAGVPGFELHALEASQYAGSSDFELPALPHGLDVLHFLLQARRRSLVHTHASGQWLWERTDV